jgi:hypothetical protein
MQDTAITAIATLAGTITGAAIVSFGNIYVARRREKMEFRMACRLIESEFHTGQLTLKFALDKKLWWRPDEELTVEAWKTHKHVLAPQISDEAWTDLWMASRGIGHANLLAAAPRPVGEKKDTLLPETVDALTLLMRDIERGRIALMPHLISRTSQWLWLISNRLRQLSNRL